MNSSPLRFPHEHPPGLSEWLEVAPGIFWLRFPLPFALNHVHVWVLEDGPGWFVIDSGIGGDKMKSLWQQIIAEKLDGKPITRLLLTHFHPDHMGSAGFLHEMFQPELLMNATEWQHARRLALDTNRSNSPELIQHYHNMGLPADLIERMTSGGNRYSRGIDIPPGSFTPLNQGDIITINNDQWQVIIGGGHSPEQVTLYCAARQIYISADQILPRISPNVSTWASNPTNDALAEYLKSLELIKPLSAESLVLPSHNIPFYGLQERVIQLADHHAERLEHIIDLVKLAPLTVHDITVQSFDRVLDHTQMAFAIGEILAHCNHLIDQKALIKTVDANGLWYLSRA